MYVSYSATPMCANIRATLPEMRPPVGRQLPRESIDRPFGKLHPPDRIGCLFIRPTGTSGGAVLLDLAERARVGLGPQWWRRRWPELMRVIEHERLREPKSRVRHETVPGRRGLIAAGPFPEFVCARGSPTRHHLRCASTAAAAARPNTMPRSRSIARRNVSPAIGRVDLASVAS